MSTLFLSGKRYIAQCFDDWKKRLCTCRNSLGFHDLHCMFVGSPPTSSSAVSLLGIGIAARSSKSASICVLNTQWPFYLSMPIVEFQPILVMYDLRKWIIRGCFAVVYSPLLALPWTIDPPRSSFSSILNSRTTKSPLNVSHPSNTSKSFPVRGWGDGRLRLGQ